jgi:hypothetical protein
MPTEAVSDGACSQRRDNYTQGKITRRSTEAMLVSQAVTKLNASLMWQVI